MDFSTIKNQMDAKDGTGYKHVMQTYADMRLVFENAMKYNEEASDVYSMAKTLLQKFEEKWAHFLPKVLEEVNGLIDWFICLFSLSHSVFLMDLSTTVVGYRRKYGRKRRSKRQWRRC